MNYKNMTIAEIIAKWDEASNDLGSPQWMFHDLAHKTINLCIGELRERGYFDRATVHQSFKVTGYPWREID